MSDFERFEPAVYKTPEKQDIADGTEVGDSKNKLKNWNEVDGDRLGILDISKTRQKISLQEEGDRKKDPPPSDLDFDRVYLGISTASTESSTRQSSWTEWAPSEKK